MLIEYNGMGLFLSFLLCSIDLYAYLYASNMLFYLSLQYSLISGSMIPLTLFFFLNIAVAIQGFLWFHMNFWYICSSSVKYIIGNLQGIALNL